MSIAANPSTLKMWEMPPNHLVPYLNQAYWGYEDIMEEDPAKGSYGMAGFAANALAECLTERPTPFPVRSYVAGDHFSISNHEPGTVLIYKSEQLYYSGERDLGEYMDQVTSRANTTSPAQRPESLLFNEENARTLKTYTESGSLGYERHLSFGVVAPGFKEKKSLVSIPAAAVSFSDGGVVKIDGRTSYEQPDLIIGRTRQPREAKPGTRILKRVNVLDVCAAASKGKGHKVRKRLGDLGFRLPSSPVHHRLGAGIVSSC
jgi:hypothetical protein